MRWMWVVLLGCAGNTSYQSRVANITTGEPLPEPTRSTPSEADSDGANRAVVHARLVGNLEDAAAIHGTCALRENGEVRCWGEGPDVPPIRGASSVAVGGYYGNTVCAVLRGRVHCWYPAREGRTEYRARGVHGATRVTPGRELTCALVEGGEVWCWGTERPASIGISDAVDVACAYSECCVAHEDGGVSCWSDEFVVEGCSDCGHGASPRERVDGLEGVVSLSSDLRRLCARQRDGAATCWVSAAGDDGSLQPRGELVRMEGGETAESFRPIGQVDVDGKVRLHDGDSPTWRLALGLNDVVELSDAECARLRDGRVACWGDEERYADDVLVDPPDEPEQPSGETELEVSSEDAFDRDATDAIDTDAIDRGDEE